MDPRESLTVFYNDAENPAPWLPLYLQQEPGWYGTRRNHASALSPFVGPFTTAEEARRKRTSPAGWKPGEVSWYCSECGSRAVQLPFWVQLNGNEIQDDTGGDAYCTRHGGECSLTDNRREAAANRLRERLEAEANIKTGTD
jgi:hypothetical protein